MTRKCWWSSAFIVLAVTAAAAAQTPRPTVMFRKGSTVNLFAGMATMPTPSRTAAIGGGAVGWELTPRFAIEGSGEWMEWGSGSHGFAAAVTALAGLAGGRDLMPFVNRHWAIRPDVREMVVLRNSRSHFVTVLAIHVAYHFEDHPGTPKVR